MGGLLRTLVVVGSLIVVWGPGDAQAQSFPEPLAAQAAESAPASMTAAPDSESSPSQSGSSWIDRFSVSAGIKIWLAKWQVPVQSFSTTGTLTTDWSPMIGPTVTVSARLRDSDWLSAAFANFTWLQSDGFDFDPARLNPDGLGINVFDGAFEAKRRDYTISAGVTVYKGVGLFAGYYNTQQRFSFSGSTVPGGAPVSGTDDFRIRGPIVGVFGSSGFNERVGLYGNAAFGILNYQTGPASQSFTASGAQAWSTEVGLNIAGPDVWKFGTTFQVGFRAQVISINVPNPLTIPGEQHRNDITWGPTFAFMGSF